MRFLFLILSLAFLAPPATACSYDKDKGILVGCGIRPTPRIGGTNTRPVDVQSILESVQTFDPGQIEELQQSLQTLEN